MENKKLNINIYGAGFYTIPVAQFCISISPLGTALKEVSAALRNFVECSRKLINGQSGKCKYTKKHPIKGKHIINILKQNDYANRKR